MKKIILSLSLLICVCTFAQTPKIDKKNAIVSIRGIVGIPKTISSSMFHTSFNGVFEANLSLNVRLFGNVFAGAGYQNSFFQNNREIFVFYRIGSQSYETKMMGQGGFIKLGFDKFFTERAYMSYALNTGLMYCNYSFINNDTSAANLPIVPRSFISPYVQPEMSLNVIVDKTLSFGFILSYTTLFTKFDPKAPRFNQIEEVHSKGNKYFMSWFNFGFGFHILLNKKAKAA